MIKYDLEKNEARIKSMAPGLFELIMLFMSILMIALSLDLELELFCNVNGGILFMVLCHGVIWLIDCIVFICIKRRKDKCKGKSY